ncbi:MAG: PASTA domain-containing protein [Thermodesulfobacteriota bacterium]|nr:PASTA domain-containing protein [Thermodesulfobacteriota bacterium]
MRAVFRIGMLFGLFVFIAGVTGYLTLRFIIRSEDVVVVPDLEGRDVVYALEILTDLGLNIKISGFEYRADIPKNHVAYQAPRPGAEVKKDRDIRIVLSKGPKSVLLPNVVGMDVREAHIIMEENGVAEGVVSRTYSQRAIRGELMGQAPAPGTTVKRGSPVDLLISLGRRPVRFKMPYLDGLTVEDAIFILERSQLNLGQIRSVQKSDLPKDVVVDQRPLAGHPVASGSLVNLTLNRSEQMPALDKGLYVFHHRVSNGWLKKHLRLRISAFGMLYDLCDVFEPPGKEVWLLIPRSPGATLFFYQDGDLVWSRSPEGRFEDPGLPPL